MKEEGPYIIRLPKAREIGARRVANLLRWIEWCKEDVTDLQTTNFPKFF
jgi:hypothetical protein